ncbi:MAG: hypothetical protein ACI91O_001779 [Candidatus Poriferisodalaceae bacterium]|jgi:hypothetical protein
MGNTPEPARKLGLRDRLTRIGATMGASGVVAFILPGLVTLTVAAVLFITATGLQVRSAEQGGKAPGWVRLLALAAVAMLYAQLAIWIGPVFALIALVGLLIAVLVLGGDVG